MQLLQQIGQFASSMWPIPAIIAFWLGVSLLWWLGSTISRVLLDAKAYAKLRSRLDNLDADDQALEQKRRAVSEAELGLQARYEENKHAIETMASEKSRGFPWLAKAYDDYRQLQDLELVTHLRLKSHPARKAAESVRQLSNDKRKAQREAQILRYQIAYYEYLVPMLEEIKGEDFDELTGQLGYGESDASSDGEKDIDPATRWLSKEEYEDLPMVEKYQRALDNYYRGRKTRWVVGRDYERYIGYLYEIQGYDVTYQGIFEGKADLGRDIIAIKEGIVDVIQCKYWSQKKLIHEKHVFQLLGTVMAYKLDNPDQEVRGVFVTSTSLSDRAAEFADLLGISVKSRFPIQHYPCVKCNVSHRDGMKIFHLPFDQQYDTTTISPERHECYVSTIKEADELGFRRAYRWHGDGVPSSG